MRKLPKKGQGRRWESALQTEETESKPVRSSYKERGFCSKRGEELTIGVDHELEALRR